MPYSHQYMFQYISCYSLSRYQLRAPYLYHCFNTSHVTLYPYKKVFGRNIFVFQYISCYSLSNAVQRGLVWKKFQYISCYSLSICTKKKYVFIHVSIHLMLLFINKRIVLWSENMKFQYISCYSLSGKSPPICKKTGVSIHLMLLFI